jgi:hypothetical protein
VGSKSDKGGGLTDASDLSSSATRRRMAIGLKDSKSTPTVSEIKLGSNS